MRLRKSAIIALIAFGTLGFFVCRQLQPFTFSDPVCLFGADAVGIWLSSGAESHKNMGTGQIPGFSIPATKLIVNGDTVYVFDYHSSYYDDGTDDMQSDIDKISEDGSRIGNTLVGWKETPHLFNCHNLMVIVYLGNNEGIIEELKVISGHQFAGGK